jgi:hypothetical protein
MYAILKYENMVASGLKRARKDKFLFSSGTLGFRIVKGNSALGLCLTSTWESKYTCVCIVCWRNLLRNIHLKDIQGDGKIT